MNVRRIKEELDRERVLLCYSGAIDQEILEELAGNIRRQLSLEYTDASPRERKSATYKIFSVFIEQAQNVVRYSEETRSATSLPIADSSADSALTGNSGILLVGCQEDGRFFVTSGNRIRTENKLDLESKLNKLQAMDKGELKKYHQEKRKEKTEVGSLGSGLGLIGIARYSSSIDFSIEQIDDEYSFFSIRAVM